MRGEVGKETMNEKRHEEGPRLIMISSYMRKHLSLSLRPGNMFRERGRRELKKREEGWARGKSKGKEWKGMSH